MAEPKKKVWMLQTIPGNRFVHKSGGPPEVLKWPKAGEEVTVPKSEADGLIRMGLASDEKPAGDD